MSSPPHHQSNSCLKTTYQSINARPGYFDRLPRTTRHASPPPSQVARALRGFTSQARNNPRLFSCFSDDSSDEEGENDHFQASTDVSRGRSRDYEYNELRRFSGNLQVRWPSPAPSSNPAEHGSASVSVSGKEDQASDHCFFDLKNDEPAPNTVTKDAETPGITRSMSTFNLSPLAPPSERTRHFIVPSPSDLSEVDSDSDEDLATPFSAASATPLSPLTPASATSPASSSSSPKSPSSPFKVGRGFYEAENGMLELSFTADHKESIHQKKVGFAEEGAVDVLDFAMNDGPFHSTHSIKGKAKAKSKAGKRMVDENGRRGKKSVVPGELDMAFFRRRMKSYFGEIETGPLERKQRIDETLADLVEMAPSLKS